MLVGPMLAAPLASNILRCDGACRKRGRRVVTSAAAAVWFECGIGGEGEEELAACKWVVLGDTDSALAELLAVRSALSLVLSRGMLGAHIQSDSDWAVQALTGRQSAGRHVALVADMRRRYHVANRDLGLLVTWIPRAANAAADMLANYAMDTATCSDAWEPWPL